MADANAPLSWRDVYKAVNDSKADILDAIASATKPIADRQEDHEARIRAIEIGDLIWLRSRDTESFHVHTEQGKRLGNAEERIAATERVLNAYASREGGFISALTVGQKLILTLGALFAAILAFLALLSVFADSIRGATGG